MSSNPFQVVRDLEAAIAEYTGAPYVVAVNSCTMALLLAVAWHLRGKVKDPLHPDWSPSDLAVEIPARTYVSVPMSIIHAGGSPTFNAKRQWEGAYRLAPLPVWDSARWLTRGLFNLMPSTLALNDSPQPDTIESPRNGLLPLPGNGRMVCVSFHASKTLGFNQGGAILHDNQEADYWLRRARFDGRQEGVEPRHQVQEAWILGWHCYMSPDVAAGLLLKLHSLPRHNDPLPNDPYPDLSQLDIFK